MLLPLQAPVVLLQFLEKRMAQDLQDKEKGKLVFLRQGHGSRFLPRAEVPEPNRQGETV